DDRGIAPSTRLALQARLDRLRRKYAIPGLSATIILRDGSTWVGTSGKADVATGRKVSRDTGFAVASVSKTFTAALVMALVEEGQIALDGSVATYLPELGLDAGITVRQLLNHTSGLSDFFFHPRIDKLLIKQPARRWRPERSLKFVGTPYFQPGRGWHYSNTNYLLLGLLVEQVTGRSLSAELRTRFLEPLGLSHTSYQPSDSPTGPLAHGYRFDVGARNDRPIDLSDGSTIVPFTSVVTAAAGAGGIAANSIDIARWARALYGGRVLSPASLQAMVEAAILTQPYQPSVPYGLGVQVLDFAGQQSLGHSGRLLGFRAVMRYLPASGLSVAVLTNQSRTDPAIVARALVAIALEAGQACSCSGSR
ncbi:MAG: serine hydrolase domain-containing protein, partial [Candidatus Limnocylindrales bacterium]